MSLASRVASLLRNLLFSARVEHELDDELRAYVEMAIDEKRSQGLADDAARRAVLLEVGGVDQVRNRSGMSTQESWSISSGRISRTRFACCVRTPALRPLPPRPSRSASAPTRRSSAWWTRSYSARCRTKIPIASSRSAERISRETCG